MSGLQALDVKALEAIHPPPVGHSPYNVKVSYVKAREAFLFPRVRTPCGHGAQVIVEGREEQSDGGEKNKDTQTNQNKQTTAHRPSLHHLVVFPLC